MRHGKDLQNNFFGFLYVFVVVSFSQNVCVFTYFISANDIEELLDAHDMKADNSGECKADIDTEHSGRFP